MSKNNDQTPSIKQRIEQPCIYIPIEVSLKEWGKANALIPKLFEHLAQNNTAPAGAPFFRYHKLGDMEKEFSLEVGVPIEKAMVCYDLIHPGTIPSGTYVTYTHQGHPDRLVQSFAYLEEWAEAQDIQWDVHQEEGEDVWAGRYEFFITDPAQEPDPEQWSIEIWWKIRNETNN